MTAIRALRRRERRSGLHAAAGIFLCAVYSVGAVVLRDWIAGGVAVCAAVYAAGFSLDWRRAQRLLRQQEGGGHAG